MIMIFCHVVKMHGIYILTNRKMGVGVHHRRSWPFDISQDLQIHIDQKPENLSFKTCVFYVNQSYMLWDLRNDMRWNIRFVMEI